MDDPSTIIDTDSDNNPDNGLQADFEVTQRISIQFSAEPIVADAVMAHRDYVMGETLCDGCTCSGAALADAVAWDLNGHACHIAVQAGDLKGSRE